MTSPLDLLMQFDRNGLTRDQLYARTLELARRDTAQLTRWIADIRKALANGDIDAEAANDVLALLSSADSNTQLPIEKTQVHIAATRVRPGGLTPPDDEATQVQLRPPVVDRDATVAERTAQKSNESTQRMTPGAAPEDAQPNDVTVRIDLPAHATAARTLRTPADASAFPPTRKAQDRTEVISDRLVKSLDDVENFQHGELHPGSIIKNRFLLEKQIGKGGMGLVFSAIDRRKQEASDPNPHVALKILNADFQRHPQSLIALQREARKAQSLAHPNVVTVFDFDRDGDAVYMTMELLKGEALEKLVREARGKGIAPQIALPIIRGIAEGLAYAHRKGIVHSDLKPGNVFILEDGTPKILDFGIARAVPSSPADDVADVFDAGTLGAYTEAYATEEMVKGIDPHPADDMYALGLIGYELLAGVHPYKRMSAPKARSAALELNPLKGLKRREAHALERCLSFDRKDRPQNAAEFLKLFRGVTPLLKTTIAAAAVLAVVAGYASYQNYLETSPTIPFSELPLATQNEFNGYMTEGDKEWNFYQADNIGPALDGALDFYSRAYSLHPRNREATLALRKVADAFLASTKTPEDRRAVVKKLQLSSDYYYRYDPVVEAAK